MAFSIKSGKLRLVFVVYWVLLAYMVAALVWWFIALNRQNIQMMDYKEQQLKKDAPGYMVKVALIEDEEKRKTAQYAGEGAIFLLLILAGAVFVYRAVRRQLKQGRQQQHFMMAITHELKTPIAVAKLNLETLQKHRLDEQQQQRLLQNTLQETNRLNALCNNLLLSSQMEAGGYRVTNENLNLTELVRECANDFNDRFPQREVGFAASGNCFVYGDRFLLQMAVNNLIDNALKYSPKEAAVAVAVTEAADEHIVLQVTDNGRGIDDAEKQKVFTRFYRTGNAATKTAKGTGLGLYLTQKIVRQHKASIAITDNTPSGAVFTIRFGKSSQAKEEKQFS
jgi:two-component system, OmpR family, sensor histidine kinase CiaH